MNIPDLKMERAKKKSDLYGNKMYIQYQPVCTHKNIFFRPLTSILDYSCLQTFHYYKL